MNIIKQRQVYNTQIYLLLIFMIYMKLYFLFYEICNILLSGKL